MDDRSATFFFVTAALLAAGCGHEGKNLSGVHQVEPPHTGAMPAAEPHGVESPANPHANLPDPHALPANPHGAMPADPHAAMPPAAAPAAESAFAWAAPAGWAESKPTGPMRMAQFDVGNDASGAPVQCVVFKGIGGDDDQNLDRWISQMGVGRDAAKLTHTEQDGQKVTRLTVKGSFTDSMKGDAKVGDATMLAAIVTAADGTKLHVKLVGPSSVVDAQTANFDAFVASIKPR
jgi:hypothetical protein